MNTKNVIKYIHREYKLYYTSIFLTFNIFSVYFKELSFVYFYLFFYLTYNTIGDGLDNFFVGVVLNGLKFLLLYISLREIYSISFFSLSI